MVPNVIETEEKCRKFEEHSTYPLMKNVAFTVSIFVFRKSHWVKDFTWRHPALETYRCLSKTMTGQVDVCLHLRVKCLGGYTLVTLPRIASPYRDSVIGTRDRVTYQKLVTR